MQDLHNQQAVSMGNARMRAVRDLNERIRQHNTDIANQITAAKEQADTLKTITQAKDTAQQLWAGSKLPDKVKAFNDWVDSKRASNPTDQAENDQREAATTTTTENTAETPAQQAAQPEAGGETLAEGAAQAETEAESAEQGTSRLMNGLKSTGAFSDETLETLGKAGSTAAKGAGVLGAAAIGGIDIYKDFEAGGLAGNNAWEKASNVLQIGGAIADLGGAAFPPAALIGGVLDLTGAALEEVGQAKDSTTTDELDQEKAAETETETAVPQQVQTASASIQ